MARGLRIGWRRRTRVVVMALALVAASLVSRPAAAQSVNVTLDLPGAGAGTVTSSPAGLTCTGTALSCTGSFVAGTSVTLTASPGPGQTFSGWNGVCTGAGGCTFTVANGLLLAATFTGPPSYVFYHLDAVGSVRARTDEARTVLARHDYDPFGEDVQPLVGDPVRFGGKTLDPETALNYFGARYYRQTWGRFTSVDPVLDPEAAASDPQRWNRYAYALNNPLKVVDPDGKEPVLAALALAWAVYEVASSAYDAYATYQTLRDPGASTAEKITTAGLFAAGMLPGIPGGAAGAGRSVARTGTEIVDAAQVTLRIERHHVFPQREDLARLFNRRGIEIDDYLLPLPKPLHRQIHSRGPRGGEWNRAWEDFFRDNPNASAEDVFRYAGELIHRFDLDGIAILD